MDQNMKTKQTYLEKYEKALRKMKRSEEQLHLIRYSYMGSAINLDGMPHAHNNADFSDYVAKLDEAERKHQELVIEYLNVWKEINAIIEQLNDEMEKDVLTYCYICLFDWGTICEKVNKSLRQVRRIHSNGIQHIKIPLAPGQQA